MQNDRLYLTCPLCGHTSIVVATLAGEVLIEKGKIDGKRKIVVLQKCDCCTCTVCEASGELPMFRR